MVIYLDMIWLLNILLDFFLLSITKNLLKDHTNNIRLLFGGLIASLIVPVAILIPTSWLLSGPGKIVFSFVIVAVSFQWHSIKRFLTQLFMFYFVTFTIGGGLSAMYELFTRPFFMNGHGLLTYGSGYGDPVSWFVILFGFPLLLWFTKHKFHSTVEEKNQFHEIYHIEVTLLNKTFQTSALMDNGNKLIDPITQVPVIVVDGSFLQNWFLKDEWKQMKEFIRNFQIDQMHSLIQTKIRLIPYRTVGRSSNVLLAIKPDKLTVIDGDEMIQTERVLVGIQLDRLHDLGNYQCLLNPKLLSHTMTHFA